jgi:hypothetical protein
LGNLEDGVGSEAEGVDGDALIGGIHEVHEAHLARELHCEGTRRSGSESGEVSDGTTLRDPIIVATLLVVPMLLLQGSDVGEPWRTVADVADWLIWLMFAAEVADLDLCAHAQRERVE